MIRKEIWIDAPPAQVWRHVTNAALISGWMMPNDFEARVGSAFTLDCAAEGKISCVVRELVLHTRLVYSFASPHIGVETTVTLCLIPEGGGTRITVQHSGWDTLPPDRRPISDTFDGGWGGMIERLRGSLTSPSKPRGREDP